MLLLSFLWKHLVNFLMDVQFLWPSLLLWRQLSLYVLSGESVTSPQQNGTSDKRFELEHVEQLYLWAWKQRICVPAFKNGRPLFSSRVWAFGSSLFVLTGGSNVVEGNQGDMRGMRPRPDLAPSKSRPAAQDTAALSELSSTNSHLHPQRKSLSYGLHGA